LQVIDGRDMAELVIFCDFFLAKIIDRMIVDSEQSFLLRNEDIVGFDIHSYISYMLQIH
jgi:hypothetical protein